MHELSIVQHFVDLAETYAKECEAKKVEFVTLEIGEMTGVISKYVLDYYPDVSKGTLLEGTELRIEEVKAEAFCRDCGNTYHLDAKDASCPACKSTKHEVLQGNKLILKEIGFV